LLTGEMKTAAGEMIDIDREDELLRFLRMKENPLVGLLHDMFRGETFLGEEMTMKEEDVKKQAEERMMMFFIRDIMEAMKQDGLLGGLVASSAYVGAGVVSYPSKAYADWLDYMGKKTNHEWTTEEMIAMRPSFNEAEGQWSEYLNLPSGKAREYYLQQHPDIDASLYFWGEKRSMQTPEARKLFNAMVQEMGMDANLWPIREPFEEYEREGKSEDEMFGDLLNLLPQYWADIVNTDRHRYTEENLVAEVNKIKLARDEAQILINEYDNITNDPKVPDTLRDKYRTLVRETRPDIDAALNLWGRVKTVRSTEALEMLKEQAQQLGIPFEQIPAIQVMLTKEPKRAKVKTKPAASGKTLADLHKEIYGK